MSGFEVRRPKPNLGYSWMVKNGLFPTKKKVTGHFHLSEFITRPVVGGLFLLLLSHPLPDFKSWSLPPFRPEFFCQNKDITFRAAKIFN
jgi:hypothetical protein